MTEQFETTSATTQILKIMEADTGADTEVGGDRRWYRRLLVSRNAANQTRERLSKAGFDARIIETKDYPNSPAGSPLNYF